MKKLILPIILLMSSALFAQTFITGNAISDADGERLFLVSLAQYNPGDLTSYLTNIVGLTESDITTASNQVSTFWSQYSGVNNTWNLQVGSTQPTQQQINTFNTTQANVVANNWSALQSNLTAYAWSRVQLVMEQAKNDMGVTGNGSGMGFGYNYVTSSSETVVSTSPLRVKVTHSMTVEGKVNFPVAATHTVTATALVGTHNATGHTSGPANSYLLESQSAYLDSNSDSCLLGGTGGCAEDDSGEVDCSLQGTLLRIRLPNADLEIAVTGTMYDGVYSGCVTPIHQTWCNFQVENYCTNVSAYQSPDFNMGGENVHWTWPVADTAGWGINALCESTNLDQNGKGHQPWKCVGDYGYATYEDPAFHGPCTYNP